MHSPQVKTDPQNFNVLTESYKLRHFPQTSR